MPFDQAWALQERLFKRVVDAKLLRRERGEAHKDGLHYLLCGHHPDVFTLGRNGLEEHLLLKAEQLREQGIEFFRINRGGDITYHGPGQLVAYPILDLDCLFTDIGRYLRMLEESVILLLAEYGLNAERLVGATGVWLDAGNPFKARKICAIGIRAGRWVTMHGLALNLNTDLSRFGLIIPCGIADKAVTSLAAELGGPVDEAAIAQRWREVFARLFDMKMTHNQNIINY